MQTDLFSVQNAVKDFYSYLDTIMGITPKQKAIELSASNQDKKVNGWSDKALELLIQFSKECNDFITEDFRLYAESNGLEKPKEPRAYGAVVLRATKANHIMWTGEYREMKNLKSHGCPKKVWCRS